MSATYFARQHLCRKVKDQTYLVCRLYMIHYIRPNSFLINLNLLMYCLWLKTFHRTLEKLGIKRTLWVSTISHFFWLCTVSATLDIQPTKFMYFLAKALFVGKYVHCMYLPSTLNIIGPKGGEQEKSKCFYKMMI